MIYKNCEVVGYVVVFLVNFFQTGFFIVSYSLPMYISETKGKNQTSLKKFKLKLNWIHNSQFLEREVV